MKALDIASFILSVLGVVIGLVALVLAPTIELAALSAAFMILNAIPALYPLSATQEPEDE